MTGFAWCCGLHLSVWRVSVVFLSYTLCPRPTGRWQVITYSGGHLWVTRVKREVVEVSRHTEDSHLRVTGVDQKLISCWLQYVHCMCNAWWMTHHKSILNKSCRENWSTGKHLSRYDKQPFATLFLLEVGFIIFWSEVEYEGLK